MESETNERFGRRNLDCQAIPGNVDKGSDSHERCLKNVVGGPMHSRSVSGGIA